jgi:hypothetical protein
VRRHPQTSRKKFFKYNSFVVLGLQHILFPSLTTHAVSEIADINHCADPSNCHCRGPEVETRQARTLHPSITTIDRRTRITKSRRDGPFLRTLTSVARTTSHSTANQLCGASDMSHHKNLAQTKYPSMISTTTASVRQQKSGKGDEIEQW